MASSLAVRIGCVVVACIIIVVLAPFSEGGVTCGQVQGGAIPCINYIRTGGAVPPVNCCDGIRSVYNAAKTPGDRQTACRCLISIAKAIPGFNYATANAIPAKCGIHIPYKLSPFLNCATIKY